jgi:amino acid permease
MLLIECCHCMPFLRCSLVTGGLILTLMLSFPLLVVPCRATMIRLHRECCGNASANTDENIDSESTDEYGLYLSNTSAATTPNNYNSNGSTTGNDNNADTLQDFLIVDHTESSVLASLDDCTNNDSAANEVPDVDTPLLTRVIITAAMLSSAMVIAAAVTHVTTVWGLLGSSANILIAFIIPCAAYLRIRKYKRATRKWGVRKRIAKALLCIACCAAVACTATNIYLLVTTGH